VRLQAVSPFLYGLPHDPAAILVRYVAQGGGAMGVGSGMDRAQVERAWRARGFSCGLWVDPPGQVWEGYVHGTDELLLVLEGELELEMQGRTFRPRMGEEVLIPARVSHSVRNVGGTTARWLYGYKK